jgi:hypothetical protein
MSQNLTVICDKCHKQVRETFMFRYRGCIRNLCKSCIPKPVKTKKTQVKPDPIPKDKEKALVIKGRKEVTAYINKLGIMGANSSLMKSWARQEKRWGV